MTVFYTGSAGRTDGLVDLENFVDANLNQWTLNDPDSVTWDFATNANEGQLVQKYNGIGGGTTTGGPPLGGPFSFSSLGTLSGPRNNLLLLGPIYPYKNFGDFFVVRVVGTRGSHKITVDLLVVLSHSMGDVDQDGTWNMGDSQILNPQGQTTIPQWLDAQKSYYVQMDRYSYYSGRYYYAGLWPSPTITSPQQHYHHVFRGGHDFQSFMMTYSSGLNSRYKLGRTSDLHFYNNTYNTSWSLPTTFYTDGNASGGLGPGAYAFSPADMSATWTGSVNGNTIHRILESPPGAHTGNRTYDGIVLNPS